MENATATQDWKAGQKILFRFFAAYFFIYIFPFPLDYIVRGLWVSLTSTLNPLIIWIGKHMLHLQIVVEDGANGSGDTSFAFAQQFLYIVAASLACMVWTIADRKRKNYKWLLYRMKVYLRCYLSFFLLIYGFSKFYDGQFPAPSLYRLSQSYGDSSPMGLAWTFFGYSQPYKVFMGIFECLGGVLLLFRRTILLGACLGSAVLLNVVMVNFCFDVPVKLFSSNLFLMAVLLAASNGRRLIGVFLQNKHMAPEDHSIRFERRGWRIAGIAVKSLFIIAFSGSFIAQGISAAKTNTTVHAPLYGLYITRSFDTYGNTLPDSLRWSKLLITDERTVLEMENKERYRPTFELDTAQKWLKLSLSNKIYNLHYQRADSNIVFSGRCASDSICIKMQRFDESKYLLTNRGFHWINEYPFNR